MCTPTWAHISVWATVPALYRQWSALCIWGVTQFLQCHHIYHSTSSLHFPRSNGFWERQVQTIKAALSTAQDLHKPFNDVLLDLQLTVPENILWQSPWCPWPPRARPRARGAFLIPSWGKVHPYDHHQEGYHARQLHCGGPRQKVLQNKGTLVAHPPQPSHTLSPRPKVPISCIPKPNPKLKHVPHPVLLAGPSSKPPCHIPHLPQPYRSAPANAAPSVKDLLWHLSALNPPRSVSLQRNLEYPQHLSQPQPHLSHWRKL